MTDMSTAEQWEELAETLEQAADYLALGRRAHAEEAKARGIFREVQELRAELLKYEAGSEDFMECFSDLQSTYRQALSVLQTIYGGTL